MARWLCGILSITASVLFAPQALASEVFINERNGESVVRYVSGPAEASEVEVRPEFGTERNVVFNDAGPLIAGDGCEIHQEGAICRPSERSPVKVTLGERVDRLEIFGFDAHVWAGSGDDRVQGSQKNAVFRGGTGDDQVEAYFGPGQNPSAGPLLIGGAGDDLLGGSFNRDVLRGGTGRDILRGKRKTDVLVGGSGRDHLDCGDGERDVAWAEVKDSVQECETVRAAT